MTDGPKEWMQYEVDWPEYSSENRTYFNLSKFIFNSSALIQSRYTKRSMIFAAIPPNASTKYRAADMEFWNEVLPNLLRHRPAGPKPNILMGIDGLINYSTQGLPRFSNRSAYDLSGSQSTNRYPALMQTPIDVEKNDSLSTESATGHDSSAITMVIGLLVIFVLLNVTAIYYFYRRRLNLKNKDNTLQRYFSTVKYESGSKKVKPDEQHQPQPESINKLVTQSESKLDLNEVIKNDKAYDNNSNFGRRSKLSRNNSSSTIETHIKVKEWIQQDIVHR